MLGGGDGKYWLVRGEGCKNVGEMEFCLDEAGALNSFQTLKGGG